MIRYILSFIVLSLIIACGNKNDIPVNIINKEKMQAILWDVFQADAFTDQFIKKDTSKNAAVEYAQLQQKIYSIHKINKVSFDKSYSWYKAHPAFLHTILDSITAKAERQRNIMIIKKYNRNSGIR